MTGTIFDGDIRRGDEIWHYGAMTVADAPGGGGGGTVSPEDGRQSGITFREIHRLDGYTSLDAKASGGSATTLPFTFTGNRLELNVAVSGQMKVGIINGDGSAIEGFSLADCHSITGDSVRLYVSWKNGSDVSKLINRPVRLQLRMTDAKLYALKLVQGS